MTKKVFKFVPYIVATCVGVIIFFCSAYTSNQFQDLLINISATFIAIPLLFIFYQLIDNLIHRKLNLEISDYSKMSVDRVVLSIISQLTKIVYELGQINLNPHDVTRFLELSKNEVSNLLRINTYLGFQLFKTWDASKNELHNVLKHPLIISTQSDDQKIAIAKIIKSLVALTSIQKMTDIYVSLPNEVTGFTLNKGVPANQDSALYNRYLLLKKISEDKAVVVDFGNIPEYQKEKCIVYYKVKDSHINQYSDTIYDLLSSISLWIKCSGNEIIIDPERFRERITGT